MDLRLKMNQKRMDINLSGFLLILFIIFKLVGVINWSWWWVLSPLWLPYALILLVLFIGGLGVVIGDLWTRLFSK
jgi:hypothetical protein